MSHVTTVETNITDLSVLRKAVRDLGGTMEENKSYVQYWGRFTGMCRNVPTSCDYEIAFPGVKWTVGVKQDGASYNLLMDVFRDDAVGSPGWNLAQAAGHMGDKIVQRYAAQDTMAQLRRKGFRCSESVDASGKVKILATA